MSYYSVPLFFLPTISIPSMFDKQSKKVVSIMSFTLFFPPFQIAERF